MRRCSSWMGTGGQQSKSKRSIHHSTHPPPPLPSQNEMIERKKRPLMNKADLKVHSPGTWIKRENMAVAVCHVTHMTCLLHHWWYHMMTTRIIDSSHCNSIQPLGRPSHSLPSSLLPLPSSRSPLSLSPLCFSQWIWIGRLEVARLGLTQEIFYEWEERNTGLRADVLTCVRPCAALNSIQQVDFK